MKVVNLIFIVLFQRNPIPRSVLVNILGKFSGGAWEDVNGELL